MSTIEELHLKLYGEKNFAIVGYLLDRSSRMNTVMSLRNDIFSKCGMSVYLMDCIKDDPMAPYFDSFSKDVTDAMSYLGTRNILETYMNPLGETIIRLNCMEQVSVVLESLAAIARRISAIMDVNKIGVIEVDRRIYYTFTVHDLCLEFNTKSFGHKDKISREDLDRFLADITDVIYSFGSKEQVETNQFLISKREIEAEEKKTYLFKFIEMCKTKCEEFRKTIESQKEEFKKSLEKSLAEKLGTS